MRETFEDMPLSLKHFLLKRTFGLDLRLVVFLNIQNLIKRVLQSVWILWRIINPFRLRDLFHLVTLAKITYKIFIWFFF